MSIAFLTRPAFVRSVIYGWLVLVATTHNAAYGMESSVPYKAITEKDRQEYSSISETIRKTISKNDLEEAMRVINFAIRKFSEQRDLLLTRAELFEGQKDLRSAIADYSRMLIHNQLDAQVLYKRAVAEFELGENDSALKDLNACIQSPYRPSPMGPAMSAHEALKLHSKILKKLGKNAEAEKEEADADYLRRRLYSGLPNTMQEKNQEPFVPRTVNEKTVINKIASLAQKGPDLSVKEAEVFLNFTPKTKRIDDSLKQLIIHGGGTDEWAAVTLVAVPDGTKLMSVSLQVNPLYTELLSRDVKQKFGEPVTPQGSSPHGPKELVQYSTESYDLSFMNFEYSTNFVNAINIGWKTPAEHQQRLKVQKAAEARDASIGTRKDEMIDWLQRLMKLHAMATADDVNAILNTKYEKIGKDWIDGNAPKERLSVFAKPDYAVEYQPEGTSVSLAQLEIRPGSYSHQIGMKQIREKFGDGTMIDATTLTPRTTGAEVRSYPFSTGSMQVATFHWATNIPDPINTIKFWWKPDESSAKTLEEIEEQVSVESLIAQSRALMAKKQFKAAWELLFKAGHRRPARRNPNPEIEGYDKSVALKKAYLDWYRMQKKIDAAQYIEYVPIIQFMIDISHLECGMITKLPTIDEYRKRHWKVTCTEYACFIRREDIPPMDVQGGALLERCQKLCGFSHEEKEIVDIPTDLIDAIYFHLDQAANNAK